MHDDAVRPFGHRTITENSISRRYFLWFIMSVIGFSVQRIEIMYLNITYEWLTNSIPDLYKAFIVCATHT